MFKRAYVEITNVCNLRCDFCPGTKRAGRFLPPEAFRVLAKKLRPHASYLYLHVMGEPLLHPQLEDILQIAAELRFRVCITTNGTLLAEKAPILLSSPALYKLSVSLHSAEGSGAGDLTDYLSAVWDSAVPISRAGTICVLRLWNIGGADARNGEIFSFLESRLGVPPLSCPRPRPGSWRLGEKLYLEQAERFDWPDLHAPETGTAFCLGLRDQLAVLADGTVVPCCLDHEGDIPLGNLLEQDLEDILNAPRARAVYEGFSRGRPPEPLCRRCGYARRFG